MRKRGHETFKQQQTNVLVAVSLNYVVYYVYYV